MYALAGFDRDGAALDFVVTADPAIMAHQPRSLGHVRAAAAPCCAQRPGKRSEKHEELASAQRVLIHGAAGGVGHLAVH